MSDLFDKRDILTGITADQAVKGDKGYFGGCLRTIAYNVEQDNVHRLCAINEDETSCFIDEEGLDYLFFLPADKVKKSCRALESFEELFDFLMPNRNTNFLYGEDGKKADYYQCEKAKVLIGRKIVLKDKITKRIRVMVIQSVEFSSDSSDNSNVYLNCFSLNELFNTYEIQINDEWVPFGVKK